MAGNNTKMNISYVIRAVDKFTKTHKRLEQQLDKIERNTAFLDKAKTLDVNADTKQYTRQMKRAEERAKQFPRNINVHVKTNYKKFRRNIDRMADAIRDFDEVMGSMAIGTLLTLAPALGPSLGVIAGGLGAVGSAATSAGLGVAGFAAVAIPSISKVVDANKELKDAQEKVNNASDEKERKEALKELAALQSKYSKEQLKSVEAIQKFSKFFSEFQAKFEPQILSSFNKTLETTQNLLTILEPAIAGVAKAVDNLIDSFNKNLEAEDMKAFFGWVGETAGPNLEKLTKAVGNFLAGFGNMMVAFDPLAQAFMDGFLDMSERFRDWSSTLEENQAFQDFLSYVKENAPTFLSLIGNMITTLVNFGIAMEPVATRVLELADAFFEWTSELFENHKGAAQVIGVTTVLIGLFRIFYPIIQLVQFAFKLLWPVIKLVGTGIGRLIPMIGRAGGIFKLFGNILMKVMPFIKGVGKRLLGLLGPVGAVIAIVWTLMDVFDISFSDIWRITKSTFSKVSSWISEKTSLVVSNVKQGWSNMKNNISNMGSTISQNVRQGWENIKNNIKTAVTDAYNSVKNKFSEMASGVTGWMNEVKANIESGWNKAKSFLEGINLYSIGADIIAGLARGIRESVGKVTGAIGSVVSKAISWARKKLDSHSPSRVFIDIGNDTGDGFAIGIEDKIRRVTKASERMTGAAISSTSSLQMPTPVYRGVSPETTPTARRTDNREYGQLINAINRNNTEGKRQPIVVNIYDNKEAVRAYINEQNAVDAQIRRF